MSETLHERGMRPKVVIIGGGFAGLAAARLMKDHPVDVTVIDRTNHHLFQPLLYQVATAALSPAEITAPIRYLLRKQKNTEVIMGEVTGVDPDAKTVTVENGEKVLPYDYLLVATGARHSYFANPEWEPLAPGLKSLQDALEIRRRYLVAFEEAEKATDPQTRREWMTFVIVGGGPTGVELAGVLPEIARHALRSDFRNIDTENTRVLLIEAGPRVLGPFPERLARIAARDLKKLGTEVRVNTRVVDINPESVTLDGGEVVRARTVIWAAGNQASPLGKMLGAPLTRAGLVVVEPDLSVPGHPEIFVAGDLAATKTADGRPVPAVAQPAIQGGKCAGRNILHRLYREPTEVFQYMDIGNMAVIGRNKAIVDLSPFRIPKIDGFSGFLAWGAWLFIHVLYLVGFRNRLMVLIQWAWAYTTYQRGARLISEIDKEAVATKESPAPVPARG
jgi:NADH:ubiquinone reductase (H+-translocating)